MTANLSVESTEGDAAGPVAPPPAATIYTTPHCMQCVATKRAFDKLLGVPYAVVDVSADRDARNMLADMGYRSAPVVITADGEHWSGFRPDRIAALNHPAVVASDASVGAGAADRATESRPPPGLDGPALRWAQAMAQRSATRTRAATDTGLSL